MKPGDPLLAEVEDHILRKSPTLVSLCEVLRADTSYTTCTHVVYDVSARSTSQTWRGNLELHWSLEACYCCATKAVTRRWTKWVISVISASVWISKLNLIPVWPRPKLITYAEPRSTHLCSCVPA